MKKFTDKKNTDISVDKKETEGIEVIKDVFLPGTRKIPGVKINLFDFSGNIKNHICHWFFLQQVKGVYVIVINPFEEEFYSQIYYWLRYLIFNF